MDIETIPTIPLSVYFRVYGNQLKYCTLTLLHQPLSVLDHPPQSSLTVRKFQESTMVVASSSSSAAVPTLQSSPPSPPSSSSSLSMRLYLLLSRPDLEDYARRVCECLAERFGVSDVAVGSAHTPFDALWHRATATSTTTTTSGTISSRIAAAAPVVLFVQLGPSTSTTRALESEGVAPLLVLPSPATISLNAPSDQNAEEDEDAVRDAALWLAKYCALTSGEVRLRVERAVAATRQSRLAGDAQLRTRSYRYAKAIADCHDQGRAITGDGVTSVEGRVRGKVRDRYEPTASAAVSGAPAHHSQLALVTTDRQSGFDRMLAVVPFKGSVLNLTSAFWFQQTEHIVPNHLLSVPHPCVSIVRKCIPFPIEFVVRYVFVCDALLFTMGRLVIPDFTTVSHSPCTHCRAYMTGSTSTSIWKNYKDGVRNYCGHALPEGMIKNQKLAQTLLTPTTKEEDHDRPISLQDIVKQGFMSQTDLDVCASAALQVFALGQSVALQRGLILVDTKYEFGKDAVDGTIRLIDEVHTPDSSRYWLASTYERRVAEGKEPDNIDKEFLRLWFRDHCDPYNDAVLPDAPRDLVLELSRRYVTLYEMITGDNFDFDIPNETAIADAIRSNLL